MFRFLIKCFILIVFFILVSGSAFSQVPTCESCHRDNSIKNLVPLFRPESNEERGIGIQDKGQIANYLGNYGVLSNFHEYFNEAIRWPAAAGDQTHYCFGLGLIVASKGNVITSVIGAATEKYDWSPKDGSRGQIFSGDVTAPPPDETPFLAMSDNPETWPEGYFDDIGSWVSTPGERHWPGKFRINIDESSPDFGKEVEGEFVSDRDIYSVFNDEDNSNPKGSLGVEVEEMAYTYGRPYAEDMLIWEFTIHNKSGQQLDSVYVGYYAIFRPDFDNKDYINIIDSNPYDEHTNGDFVYIWDINNIKDGAWATDPTDLGIVGLNILETPKDLGVTDFHYFSRDVAPSIDEQMWPIVSSNPNDPNLIGKQYYFHGNNRRIDNTEPDSLSQYFPEGAPINYFIMTGPLTLAPDEKVVSSVAVVMGSSGNIPFEPDTSDLMNNMRVTQQMFQRKYQGSGPPKTPVVQAHPNDKQVRIVWDSDAENSKDNLTGKIDFEGYKIYRSDDLGKTWGTPITNQYGNVIGYKPLKIFDLIDGIKGLDPAFNQSLGDDSGLKHSFIDDNVINGIEYWYCVTSYDKGNQNPDSLEQSYQSALGHSVMESHTVSAIPGTLPQNYNDATYDPVLNPDGSIPPIGGLCQGLVKLDIIQPDSITGDDYLITFVDSTLEIVGSDTNYVLGFNLYRISAETGDTSTVLDHHLFSNDTEDNLPVTDGFRLTVLNSPSGTAFIGWTKVNGDTSTFYWNTKPVERWIGDPATAQEDIYTVDDYRVTIDTTLSGGLSARLYDFFLGISYPDSIYHLPLKVEVITDPENPIDINENTWLVEFNVTAPWEGYREYYYSQLGWDLIPGGLAYTKGSPGFYERYIDMLNFEKYDINPGTGDTTITGLLLQTNNLPDTYVNAYGDTMYINAVAPSQGDEFTILTYKPFRKEITYEFTTNKAEYTAGEINLNEIRVVPDPYIVSNEWETSQFGKKLMFNHLPSECKISIFTVAGDHIDDIYHNDNRGFEFWDMRTYNDQYIAYGLYIYIVSVPNGQKKVGKFLVIK
ncbi:MAG: hypothetical protein OQK64_08375 [Ignavibacteriaceae bacterium]|nr:hypothetical protein [Ignavibacteriaceae bacterium]